MKKAIALVLTTALLIFGSTFFTVQASNSGDEFPDPTFPISINQG